MAADKLQLAKQQMEAFSAGDWGRLKGLLTADAVYEETATQRRIQGPDAIVEVSKGWKVAFPDVKGTITQAFECGNSVAQEIAWEGTHTGELAGPMGTVPPTGRRVKIKAAQLLTFKGDKIAETKHFFDLLTMLAQIGAVPVPARA